MTKSTTETTETTQAARETPAEPADATQAKAPRKRAKPETEAARTAKKATKGGGTLRDVAEGYLTSMEQGGKSEGTMFSYRMELRLALEALGEETPVAKIAVADVAGFFASDPVNKTRTGLPKSPLSVAKTQRVLRQALVHAVAEGLIEKAPLPEKA
jgi:hypothetical protein